MNLSLEQVHQHIAKELSPERLRHVLGVAVTMRTLCERFGLDDEKGQLAALCHDLAREWPESQILSWAGDGGIKFALHGKAACAFMKATWSLDDAEVLEAVECHTLGKAGMGNLARALFVADYIEPGRSHVTPEFRRSLLEQDLPQMVKSVIEHAQTHFPGSMQEDTRALYLELGGKA